MDRVNRTFFLASTLLATAAICFAPPFSYGQSPNLRLAVGQADAGAQAVRQVAGRQPSQQQTRPGLLQVLAGASSKGSENHYHQNMEKTPSKGLLDTLFSRGKEVSHNAQPPHSHASHQQHQHRQAAMTQNHAAMASNQQPDWSGVPFHSAEPAQSGSGSVPLRDPGAAEPAGTRIVRGGSSRTIEAIPAASRQTSPLNDSVGTSSMALPTPPRDISVIAREPKSESFSTSSSSRRSARRNVDTLVPFSQPTSGADRLSKIGDDDEVADLVPKVARKPAPKTTSKQEASEASAAGTKSNENKAEESKRVESKSMESKSMESKPSGTQAANEKPADQSQTKTAMAESGHAGATTSPEPISNLNEQRTPSAAVAKRMAASPESSTATLHTTGQSSSPAAGHQAPSKVSSLRSGSTKQGTPAIAASHRSGPPSQAFGPEQIQASSEQEGEKGFAPSTRANAASSPIGSGVVSNGGVASYRRPASPPDDSAPSDSSNVVKDPYGDDSQFRGRQMSTRGQPVPPSFNGTAPVPAADMPALPIDRSAQPIGGYTASPNPLVGDQFTGTTPEARNQMRSGRPHPEGIASASTSELPGIRVTTYGPGAIMIRQTNQYEIRVENRGAIDASGVMVRALVPDWADLRGQNATRGDIDNQKQGSSERLVWTIDELPAGAAETMYIRLTAARSGTYDLDVDWTLIPQKSTAKVQVREPRLDLTIEGPDEVVFGQSQTYKVRVLNPGDGTAPNVVFTLSPNSATPQSQRIGDIPPGKEAQFDVELTAQDLGDLKIHGLASGELELRAEAEKTIRVAAAKLEAVLSGPQVKYQNTEAMYSLQLQNNGTAPSERISASLRLPTGVKYLGGIQDAIQEGAVLRWEISALAPGANRNYQFRCNMGSTGEHLFSFDCRGSAAGSATVSIATRVESIADLVLTVSDPPAPAPIGTDVTYEIVIRNRGSKEATDVRAIAQFSHGIEPQRIEGQSGEVMTGQVLFDPIPRIGAGQEVRMKVIAQADRPGHHRFRTEIRSGDTVLVAEEATHYMSPKGERVSRRSSETVNR